MRTLTKHLAAALLLLVAARADTRIVAPAYAPVQGTSMLPMFTAGQVVFVYPCEFDLVLIGQPIVWFEEARQINVLHSVIAIRQTAKGRGLVTKGIANTERDPHLATKANFVGCVDSP